MKGSARNCPFELEAIVPALIAEEKRAYLITSQIEEMRHEDAASFRDLIRKYTDAD